MICNGNTHFSVNLYHGDRFIGNLKIAFVLRPFRAGDSILCQYFSKLVEMAVSKLHSISDGRERKLTHIFRTLLLGTPLSNLDRQFVSTHLTQTSFQCMKIVCGKRSSKKVPMSYFADQLSKTFQEVQRLSMMEQLP